MKTILPILLMVLALQGCQTVPYAGQARDVSLKPQTEGVLSIPVEFRDEDRAKATEKMARNCAPFKPAITEEGEVAVGEKVISNTSETQRASTERQMGSIFGVPLVSGDKAGKDGTSSSTTTQVKEWRITYRCDRKTKVSL